MSESSRDRETGLGDGVRWITFNGEQVSRYASDEELLAAVRDESFEDRKLAAHVSNQVTAAIRRLGSA